MKLLRAAHRPASRAMATVSRAATPQVAAVTTSQCCSPQPILSDDTSPLKGRFMIPAEEVRQLLADSGNTLEEMLFSLITPASKLARPPISNFYVGSVALGGSGNVYVGVNIEFPHTPLNNSIHSEQCLLVNCLHSGETSIQALAVSAAPCGHCRQFYAEIKDADALEYIFGRDAKPKYLPDLLPERFGPQDLQHEPFPLLLERQRNPVAWHPDAEAAVAARSDDAAFQEAAAEALTEAQQCYAPYTRCYSGAAIIAADGQVFSGGYIESAAYNPSLAPFQSAFVDAVTHHALPTFDQIREVVLAERPGANVQHSTNMRLLLAGVAPAAQLTVLPLQ